MGRYYNGDIDGKWWFGVQSSITHERFGSEPSYYTYYINKEDVEKTMKDIIEGLGDKIKMFEKFFKENNGYTDERLIEFFRKKYPSYDESDLSKDLSEYADYTFGDECLQYYKDHKEDYLCVQSEL